MKNLALIASLSLGSVTLAEEVPQPAETTNSWAVLSRINCKDYLFDKGDARYSNEVRAIAHAFITGLALGREQRRFFKDLDEVEGSNRLKRLCANLQSLSLLDAGQLIATARSEKFKTLYLD